MSEKTPRAKNKEVNFTSLRQESSRQSYKGHPAIRSSIPELYYTLLLSILTVDDATEEQWLHLYRVATGAKYDTDIYDLLPAAYSLTNARLIEAIDSIQRDDLTNAFLLDSILLALLHKESSSDLLAYIADLATLFSVPQETVNEAMRTAKSIVSKDYKAYLATMSEAEYLDIGESYCYLFKFDEQNVIHNLDKAASIEIDHLTVTFVKAISLNLNLDDWAAKKITFRDCIFENSAIKSSQKEVNFIRCTFLEKNKNFGDTYISLEKSSALNDCLFKNIVSTAGVLSLANTEIAQCTFSNCSISGYDEIFLTLYNGTITDSEFIRCHCNTSYTLFSVKKTAILRCKFSYCKTTCYTRIMKSILQAETNSTITDCYFNYCIVTNNPFYDNCVEDDYDDYDDYDDGDISIKTTVTMTITIDTYIICHSDNSTERNNNFYNCHTGSSLFTAGNLEKPQYIHISETY